MATAKEIRNWIDENNIFWEWVDITYGEHGETAFRDVAITIPYKKLRKFAKLMELESQVMEMVSLSEDSIAIPFMEFGVSLLLIKEIFGEDPYLSELD